MDIKKILKGNNILKIGSLSLLATIMIRAINLISVPIFSRLLTTTEYGQVEVFMTYVNIFFVILGLDFQGAVGKGHLDFKENVNQFLCSSLIFTTISASIIVIIINVLFVFLQRILGVDRGIVNIMFLYSYSMFVMNYRSADYNFMFEYKKNMRMTVPVGILNLVLSFIFIMTLFQNNHIMGRVLGATIPTFICAVIVYFGYIKRGNCKFEREYYEYSFKFGVPLIPHNLSTFVLSSSDRIMINSMISSAEAGIYSLAYTLGIMIAVASEAMNQVFSPWLFRRMEEQDTQLIKKTQRVYLLGFCAITMAVFSISPEIIKIIGAKAYWDGINIIIWIVFATFLNFVYTLYVNIEFYYKATSLISCGTIIAAIINFVLNMFFLQKFGYIFAAISTVISYFALLIFHAIIVNYVLKARIVDNKFIFMVVFCVFLSASVMQMLIISILARIIFAIVMEALIGILVYYLYRIKK